MERKLLVVSLQIIFMFLVSSCAHTPNATVSYYLPKSKVSVKVIRTVACNQLNEPKIQAAVITTTSFVADRDSKKTIALSELDGKFANTSMKMNFYPDGRLSGVNASSKGTGKDIVVAALKVVALAAGMAFDGTGRKAKHKFPKECKYIADSTKDDVVSLVYEGGVNLENTSEQKIEPAIESAADHWMLSAMFGDTCAVVTPKTTVAIAPVVEESQGVKLAMREPAMSTVVVSAGATCLEQEYWRGGVLDSKRGQDYFIPIHKAAAFGRNSFGVEIAESGRITSLAYEKDTGVGDATSAVGAALEAFKTDAEKAAELNAEADLILAQERLVKCQANRANCTK